MIELFAFRVGILTSLIIINLSIISELIGWKYNDMRLLAVAKDSMIGGSVLALLSVSAVIVWYNV